MEAIELLNISDSRLITWINYDLDALETFQSISDDYNDGLNY